MCQSIVLNTCMLGLKCRHYKPPCRCHNRIHHHDVNNNPFSLHNPEITSSAYNQQVRWHSTILPYLYYRNLYILYVRVHNTPLHFPQRISIAILTSNLYTVLYQIPYIISNQIPVKHSNVNKKQRC